MQDKFEIADALRETGLLLSVIGENSYKARAYIRGASAIESLSESIDVLIAEERLTEVAGIGPSLATSIVEIYNRGESRLLHHLRSEFPPGVIELSQVPGLTLKRIRALHDALGITSIAALQEACESGSVRQVKGFGAKSSVSF